MIVEAKFDEVDTRIDEGVRQAEAAQIVKLARQLDIVVFKLGAPIAADGELDAEELSREYPSARSSDRSITGGVPPRASR